MARDLTMRWKTWRLSRRPFYRRFVSVDSMRLLTQTDSLDRIDGLTTISRTNRFLYVRVPKCANTTIMATLSEYERPGDSPLPSVLPDERLRKSEVAARYFCRPSALSSIEVEDVERTYRKFIFVRNPFVRAASVYLHKFRSAERLRHFGLPDPLPFARFCDFLRDGGLYEDAHWMPQWMICPIPVEMLDFVGRLESLSDDLDRLLPTLYGRHARLVSRDRHATGAADRIATLYGRREQKIIAEVYRRDFLEFGYDADRLPV